MDDFLEISKHPLTSLFGKSNKKGPKKRLRVTMMMIVPMMVTMSMMVEITMMMIMSMMVVMTMMVIMSMMVVMTMMVAVMLSLVICGCHHCKQFVGRLHGERLMEPFICAENVINDNWGNRNKPNGVRQTLVRFPDCHELPKVGRGT